MPHLPQDKAGGYRGNAGRGRRQRGSHKKGPRCPLYPPVPSWCCRGRSWSRKPYRMQFLSLRGSSRNGAGRPVGTGQFPVWPRGIKTLLKRRLRKAIWFLLTPGPPPAGRELHRGRYRRAGGGNNPRDSRKSPAATAVLGMVRSKPVIGIPATRFRHIS